MHWLMGLPFPELKRTVYFWGLCFGAVTLLAVWWLTPGDPYIRLVNPILAAVFVLWCVQLRRTTPTESVERQVALALTLVFGGKLLYYLFAPDPRANWFEIEDTFWNLAFQMVIFYMIFDARRGLALAMGLTAFTVLAGLARFLPEALAGRPHEMIEPYVRCGVRLFSMGLMLFIMARIKDRLVLVSHQMEQTQRLARTDALTGIANRMAVSERLEAEVGRPQGLYAVLMDIDHFKRINDQHGHALGDYVLQEVAQRLRARLRRDDHLGRWGGEEFLLLMRADHPGHATEVVERLRESVLKEPFDQVGAVTASFGVAPAAPGDTARTLLQRADIALYKAKNSGRDRVELEAAPLERALG